MMAAADEPPLHSDQKVHPTGPFIEPLSCPWFKPNAEGGADTLGLVDDLA